MFLALIWKYLQLWGDLENKNWLTKLWKNQYIFPEIKFKGSLFILFKNPLPLHTHPHSPSRCQFTRTYPQISFLCVLLAADFAWEWFFSSVCDQMALHSGNADKSLATNTTDWQNLGWTFSNTWKICKNL